MISFNIIDVLQHFKQYAWRSMIEYVIYNICVCAVVQLDSSYIHQVIHGGRMKLTKRKGILPVGIHALRIASLLFLRPNLVIIPITAKSIFLVLFSLFSMRCFAVNPSSLALSNSNWCASNFFCCSLANTSWLLYFYNDFYIENEFAVQKNCQCIWP